MTLHLLTKIIILVSLLKVRLDKNMNQKYFAKAHLAAIDIAYMSGSIQKILKKHRTCPLLD